MSRMQPYPFFAVRFLMLLFVLLFVGCTQPDGEEPVTVTLLNFLQCQP